MSEHNDVLWALNRLILCVCIAGAQAATTTNSTTGTTSAGEEKLFNLSETAQDTLGSSIVALGIPMGVALAVFVVLRPYVPRAYLSRLSNEGSAYKPERWLRNMFFCKSDEAFANGISLDGCMQILTWEFGSRVFLWFVLISPLPLCINWFGAGFECPDTAVFDYNDGYDTVKSYTNPDGTKVLCGEGISHKGVKYDTFTRLTMTAFQKENLLAWGHIATMWILTFVVIRELGRANSVFTKLRSKWILQREEPVASSVMVINAKSRSDKEFYDLFERMFPGKVVGARLVKFCRPLADTCAEIAAVEEKIKLREIKDAAKNKKGTNSKESTKVETAPPPKASSDVEQQRATQEDADVEAVKQSAATAATTQNGLLAMPGEAFNKVGNLAKNGLKLIVGADLDTQLAQLLEKKKAQQKELFARMEQRELKVAELREAEDKARKQVVLNQEIDFMKSTKELFTPNGIKGMANMMGAGATTVFSGAVGAVKTVGGTVQGIVPVPAILDDDELFSTMGFVTFTDISTATLAVQASYSSNPDEWQMSVAPNPKDVVWYDLATKPRSTNQKNNFLIYVVVVALFISWSPVVIYINAQVSSWLDERVEEVQPTGFVEAMYGLVEGILKNIANIIFFMMLPKLLFKVLILSGRVSKNSAFLEVQHYLVLFKIFFTVFATSLGKPTSELFHKIITSFETGGTLDLSGFSFSATFGTSVPSEFPTMFAFAITKLPDFASGLAQFDLFQTLAMQILIWRMPVDYAWKVAQEDACRPMSTPKRFASGAVLFGIGLLIYLVFPLNAVMFFALFVLGGACFRYRVLYTDQRFIDSGGIFWTQFEFHVAAILIVMQITAVVVITSILGGLWTLLVSLPLPIISAKYLLHLRKTKWQFANVADPDFIIEDIEAGKSSAVTKTFPYVQPELATPEDLNAASAEEQRLSKASIDDGISVPEERPAASPVASLSSPSLGGVSTLHRDANAPETKDTKERE